MCALVRFKPFANVIGTSWRPFFFCLPRGRDYLGNSTCRSWVSSGRPATCIELEWCSRSNGLGRRFDLSQSGLFYYVCTRLSKALSLDTCPRFGYCRGICRNDSARGDPGQSEAYNQRITQERKGLGVISCNKLYLFLKPFFFYFF